MAYGGTTTHIDFVYVRPGVDSIQAAIEQRAARWKGNSHVDYAYHITMSGALDLKIFEQIPEAIRAGYPELQGLHDQRAAAPSQARRATASTSGGSATPWRRSRRPAASWSCTARTRTWSSSTTSASAPKGAWTARNLHLVHTKLSELLAFRRTVALARAMSAAVYFVHTSAKEGVDTIGEARANGQPVYGETLHQYACFNAEYYKTPRGFCSHTYPSLKFPEDQEALWRGLVHDGLATLATDEYPTSPRAEAARPHHRGRDRRQRGRRGAHGHRLQRGRGQAQDDARALRRHHVDQRRARSSGSIPKKGAIAAGSDADLVFIDPTVRKTLVKDDFHVTDYSPWEGWTVTGWPVTTLLRGKVIVDRGKLVGTTSDGRQLTRTIDPVMLRRPAC